MAKNAIEFRPPLGLFRRIRERESGVDLKKGGIIPIVAIDTTVLDDIILDVALNHSHLPIFPFRKERGRRIVQVPL